MATEHRTKRRRMDDDSEEEEAINPKPSPISNLGNDVLAEVLIRAPEPGSAWRCKAVCKRWNSLISDPLFVRRFISHHHHKRSGEVEEPPLISTLSREFILSFLPLPHELGCHWFYFKIYDSYKDLVLCGFQDGGGIHAEFSRSLLLCNPFTKQWIALPLVPRPGPSVMGFKVPRLVCEPRDCVQLDLGEGRPPFIYSSAYRFRVVCVNLLSPGRTGITVFCSESGEWTKEALVLDGPPWWFDINVVSTDGGLVWLCLGLPSNPQSIVGFNPFRLDIPPIRFDVSRLCCEAKNWNIAVSRGALHLISLGTVSGRPAFLSVQRLEEDGKSWTIQHKTLFRCDDVGGYEPKDFNVVALHPEKPHIVFFKRHCTVADDRSRSVILSYDMKTGELRYIAKFTYRWMVYQPRVSCWPTPIPRYEELRGIYDGRYSCWVQQRSSSTLSNCGRVVKRRVRQWLDSCSGWFNY